MGRICYHPCETACNRAQLDEAVGINSIERFLGDLAIEQGWPLPAPGPGSGGGCWSSGPGPPGLCAAYHLRRLGHGVAHGRLGPQARRDDALRHPRLPPAARRPRRRDRPGRGHRGRGRCSTTRSPTSSASGPRAASTPSSLPSGPSWPGASRSPPATRRGSSTPSRCSTGWPTTTLRPRPARRRLRRRGHRSRRRPNGAAPRGHRRRRRLPPQPGAHAGPRRRAGRGPGRGGDRCAGFRR